MYQQNGIENDQLFQMDFDGVNNKGFKGISQIMGLKHYYLFNFFNVFC